MIGLIQRVSHAKVTIDNAIRGAINQGLLLLLGIEEADQQEDIDWLCKKVIQLRIFPDEEGLMNKSLIDIGGELLVVSQFTLHASTKKGNRPSFIKAAKPEQAQPLYEAFLKKAEELLGKSPESGEFGANMQVSLLNDGPVTLIIDTKNKQ